jgi:hypothetical protein
MHGQSLGAAWDLEGMLTKFLGGGEGFWDLFVLLGLGCLGPVQQPGTCRSPSPLE